MNNRTCKKYCLQQHRYPATKKPQQMNTVSLVLFDMDGVLVDAISSWKFVHQYYHMNNDASVKAYVKGEIDDAEFIRRDVSLWMEQDEPMTTTKLHELLSTIPLMHGASSCLQWIHQQGIPTAIVSAGIKTLASIIGKDLGVTHIYANELLADAKGYLTGEGIVEVPLKEKDATVRNIHDQTGIAYDEMVAVGNSCYDIPMLASVGLGVAFNPADTCILSYADKVIQEKDLSLLIPIIESYL